MMMEKLLIEEQIIKRWHQKTITRPSPIDLHPNFRLRLRQRPMSEVREYAMILQTIMLTNVLNNNDSYVCSSSLYIRSPLNSI